MLEIKNGAFCMDGKHFNIYSGAMHYFRIPCEYWADRLRKLKAAGFNTVETYVAWNVHQPKDEEVYDFEGQNNVFEFIRTAQREGIYVIVRPGPYICAEWEFGGFPPWLLKYDDIKLRCYNERYIGYVKSYFDVLIPKLAELQVTKGGPIIAVQIENEYGSYGTDKKYLRFIRDNLRQNGINVLLFTSDGESKYCLSGGSLPEEFKVVNFGSYPKTGFADLKEYQPDKPLMCGEMWCGWFDHFREKHHGGVDIGVKKRFGRILNEFFEQDASFNFYMFHGGTNFGYMAGANYAKIYQPTTTSYDYGAPLNEYGDYTKKYYVMRELLCRKQGIEPPELPPRPQTQYIGEVKLTESASFIENIKLNGTKHSDHFPHYMEHYGQNYGMILYHTEIEGDYPATSIAADGVHDIASVYVNGKLIGRFDRSAPLTKKQVKAGMDAPESFSFPIPAFNGKITVDILVEAMGRINFAKRIHDRKGLKNVMIGDQYIYDFDVYTIPLDKTENLTFTNSVNESFPVYLKGKFKASSKHDCFVDIRNFTKGYVFVNGINLGRYWNVGPQRTLYIPGVWLKEENEIIVFETQGFKKPVVEIIDKHIFK